MKLSLVAALPYIAVLGFVCSSVCTAADLSRQHVDTVIKPLLKTYCIDCHGPDKDKGGLRIDELSTDWSKLKDVSHWAEIRDQLNLGEMPPRKSSQPKLAELHTLVDWVSAGVTYALQQQSGDPQKVVLRRLTRQQYGNTMRDLLHIELSDLESGLPQEQLSPEGFNNNGDLLVTSPYHIETYAAVARQVLDKVIVLGDKPKVSCEVNMPTMTYETKVSERGGKKRTTYPSVPIYRFPEKGQVWEEVDSKGRTVQKRQWPYANLSHLGSGALPHPEGGVWLTRSYGISTNPKTRDFGPFYLTVNHGSFPFEGTFRMTVTLGAKIPEGAKAPWFELHVGYDTEFRHSKMVGKVRVTNSTEHLQEVHFSGDFANFPMPKRKKHRKQSGLRFMFVSRYTSMGEDKNPAVWVKGFHLQAPYHAQWPPVAHQKLLPPANSGQGEASRVREVLTQFMRRAYRRPVTDAEVNTMMKLYGDRRDSYASMEQAIKAPLVAVLCSPSFLFLSEPDSTAGTLNAHQLASRLSYLMWNTMPDAELMACADNGSLLNDAVLIAQAKRLLADHRSWTFIRSFTDQWLKVEQIETIAVNSNFYHKFNDNLKPLFKEEIYQLIGRILKDGRSSLDIVDAPYIMTTNSLAKHYRLKGVHGKEGFYQLKLPDDSPRGGLLTSAGMMLTTTPGGEETSVIKRAVYFMDRILGTPPPPPPPNVPDLEEANFDEHLPVKEKLAAHMKKAACASCHSRIDHWGFMFEQYDGVGRPRHNYFVETIEITGKKQRIKVNQRGPNIDASGQLPDGTTLNGVKELKAYLLEHRRNQIIKNIASKMLAYALGRSVTIRDEPLIDALVARCETQDHSMQSLLIGIVSSPAFRRH